MKWEDLLCIYEDKLEFINRQRKYCSKDCVMGMYRMLRLMVHQMCLECEDLPEIDYSRNTFFYRGYEYEVVIDDAGQQSYIDLGNVVLSGEAFNDSFNLEWMESLNNILDKKYYPWLNEYNI